MTLLALQAAMAFNLVCTGTQTTGRPDPTAPDGIRDQQQRPVTGTYRVDLQNMRWCLGDCARTYQISSVSGAEIVLQDARGQASGTIILMRVNLETGQYHFAIHLGQYVDRRLGTCEQTGFSGIPAL